MCSSCQACKRLGQPAVISSKHPSKPLVSSLVEAIMTAQTSQPAEGFYCSTSEEFFSSKEALQEHYKSDFHRCHRL